MIENGNFYLIDPTNFRDPLRNRYYHSPVCHKAEGKYNSYVFASQNILNNRGELVNSDGTVVAAFYKASVIGDADKWVREVIIQNALLLVKNPNQHKLLPQRDSVGKTSGVFLYNETIFLAQPSEDVDEAFVLERPIRDDTYPYKGQHIHYQMRFRSELQKFEQLLEEQAITVPDWSYQTYLMEDFKTT
ncbi:MAG TPA: hypothetical protein VLG12_01115 [Candidatus Saccharimonadales bacterium]|nr:hypothetical protein [Candidatus Saccharimonadales bacterium]